MIGGTKFDGDKPRLDLIPPEAIFALGEVLSFGAKKYGDRNWEKGMEWGRLFAAAQRHLWAWQRGDKRDEETGYSHLWHALCCISMLVAYEQREQPPAKIDLSSLSQMVKSKEEKFTYGSQ